MERRCERPGPARHRCRDLHRLDELERKRCVWPRGCEQHALVELFHAPVLEHIDTIDLRRTVAIAGITAAHFPGTPFAATLQLPAAEALVVQLAGPSLTVR